MNFHHYARALVSLAGLALIFGAPARAQDLSPGQRSEVEQIIRDYLLRKPEVLKEAFIELQKRERTLEAAERQKTLAEQSQKIFNSKYQAVVGNPKGAVTLVEFFDYNCGYCKKAYSDLAKLMKEFPDLRVVLKEFPVLGQGSIEAAQVASALRNQANGEKYLDFHQRLLGMRGQVGKAQALAAARESGADIDKLEKDLKSPDIATGISEALEVGDKLSINGTPAWIIGDEVVMGAVGYQDLRGKIANTQKCGKTNCG